MKKQFLISIFLLISAFTFAQNNYQEVVYLKNGSVIRGVIIEQVPNKSLKIETTDGNLFVYEMSAVVKITKEMSVAKADDLKKRMNAEVNKDEDDNMQTSVYSNTNNVRYRGIVELGNQMGVGDIKRNRTKANFINGIEFNKIFSAGLGLGLRTYNSSGWGYEPSNLVPVFADFRLKFSKKKISPYAAFAIGYSYDSNSSDFTGVGRMTELSLGISYMITEKSAINVSLGYENQNYKSEDLDKYSYDPALMLKVDEKYPALSLNLGFSF